MSHHPLSYIEPFEEEEAKRFIDEKLGFDPPRPCGHQLYIKIYVRDEEIKTIKDNEGIERKLYIPATASTSDRFRSCVGLVIAQGPDCYKDSIFRSPDPWCRIGDWVIFPRHEGMQIVYRGIPMMVLPDNKIAGIVEDPTYVTRE